MLTVLSLLGLLIVACIAVAALNASRIPRLRELLGAAPLHREEPESEEAALTRDFAASDRAGYVQRATWDDDEECS